MDVKVNRLEIEARDDVPDRDQIERGFKAAIQDASNQNFFLK